MIISLRLKNFYSIRDEAVLDFAADTRARSSSKILPDNLIDFAGDKFVNVIGLFGSNAAGKSNMIKAIGFCRDLILNSHTFNEGDELEDVSFKFDGDKASEFGINFIVEGTEYEYSFELLDGKIKSESLYYYPNNRKSKIFVRTDTDTYSFKKGLIGRPAEVASNTGSKNLFLSRASSMNRDFARTLYRFFLHGMMVGIDSADLSKISVADFEKYKKVLLVALEVSDSDIVDIRLAENGAGQRQILSYHKENPAIAFDFFREESDGTKRLLAVLTAILTKMERGATFFIDEFDLKLHLRLAEFILDLIRASRSSQMVFTSHNPWLINKDSLRKEQMVFVSKLPDGSSDFTPLCDFEGLSKNSDPRQAYLLGRFDAVPYVGSARNVVSQLLDEI